MNNVLECANTSLELLELIYTNWPLGVLILISIDKAVESSCGLLWRFVTK